MIKLLYFKINNLFNNPFFIQSITTMILRIIGVTTLFGFTFFLTHNFDPKIIGKYDFIRTFLLVISSITIFGADQSIIYFSGVLKSKNQLHLLEKIYLKSYSLIIAISFFVLLVIMIIGKSKINNFFNDLNTFDLIFKAAIILTFYSITLFNTETIRALNNINLAELYRNIFKYFSVIIGSIILLKFDLKHYLPETFLVGFIFLAIISTINIVMIFKKKRVNVKNDYNQYSYNYIFKKSFPIGISTLAIFCTMSIDVFFIKKFYGNEMVAYYSIAMKFVAILLMIMNSVTITVSSKIAEFFEEKNFNKLNQIMKKSARLIFFLSLPISILFIYFINEILSIFGSAYLVAKLPLTILLISQTISSVFGAVQVYMNMTGRQLIFQIIIIFAVFISLVLNYYLIPIYGMSGAAISYGISVFFWNSATAIIIYRLDKVNVMLR